MIPPEIAAERRGWRRLSRRRLVAVGVLGAVAALVAVTLLVGLEYETQQTATRSFLIDADFTDVRKILVRTDASKQIVTLGGTSTFIDQQWSAIGGELDPARLIQLMVSPTWRLELHGVLRVRTSDEYIGEHEIALEQDVEIEPDFLHSEVELERPAERLKDYRQTTRFSRDEQSGKTRVDLKLTQRILTDAPWFAHGIADRRVRASAEKALANTERGIQEIIADNIDDVPVFPLR